MPNIYDFKCFCDGVKLTLKEQLEMTDPLYGLWTTFTRDLKRIVPYKNTYTYVHIRKSTRRRRCWSVKFNKNDFTFYLVIYYTSFEIIFK